MFSVHRSHLSASHLSGSASSRQEFLSAVCWLSECSHYMAEEQTTDANIWQSAFLHWQLNDDLQSSPGDRWRFIPMRGGRRGNPHPVCCLQHASNLWVYWGHSHSHSLYASFICLQLFEMICGNQTIGHKYGCLKLILSLLRFLHLQMDRSHCGSVGPT